MSRSFHPPETLSKEDIRTIADVRRDIWTNSFYGMGYGSLTGITGHVILSSASRRGLLPQTMKFNRNTALLSFLLGGALGSFLAATVTGKNEVHNLHPIFEVGATKPDEKMTNYQRSLQRAQERDLELRELERGRLARKATEKGENLDAGEERRRNRQFRRLTLRNKLEQPGMNESREKKWLDAGDVARRQSLPNENPEVVKEQRRRNRFLRRTSLRNTLENQHGLNDSHGGEWVNDTGRHDKNF